MGSTEWRQSAPHREGTYQVIIEALRDKPAYVLVFGIGLLGGLLGAGTTTVGFVRDSTTVVILGFAAWVALLGAALLVIVLEHRRPTATTHLARLDQTAREAFLIRALG